MTDEELREWALARYGSRDVANNLTLIRVLYEDVQTLERDGEFPTEAHDPTSADMAELKERLRSTNQ